MDDPLDENGPQHSGESASLETSQASNRQLTSIPLDHDIVLAIAPRQTIRLQGSLRKRQRGRQDLALSASELQDILSEHRDV